MVLIVRVVIVNRIFGKVFFRLVRCNMRLSHVGRVSRLVGLGKRIRSQKGSIGLWGRRSIERRVVASWRWGGSRIACWVEAWRGWARDMRTGASEPRSWTGVPW